MTTYAAWINGLAGISVTGVTKNYGTDAPTALVDAQLPAMWVRFPRGEQAPITAEGGANLQKRLRAEVVVIVAPVLHGLHSDRVDEVLTMMDNLSTALANNDVAISKNEFSIRPYVIESDSASGGKQYTAMVAEVWATG